MSKDSEAKARRLAARLAAGDLCAEPECGKPRVTCGLCQTHYNRTLPGYGAPPKDMEKRRASWRAKNHRRRQDDRGDLTPARELAMRKAAKRCPMPGCGVKLTDEPLLPNSKELDHMVTRHMGGTKTEGNVRIICRLCNGSRPKDGSDYIGPVTLWAVEPGFVQRTSRGRPRCEHGVLSSARCYECRPRVKPSRQADGQKAAELRANGMGWAEIAELLGFGQGSNAARAARAHGQPDVVARWPRTTCGICGADIHRDGRGRPRLSCDGPCRQAAMVNPEVMVKAPDLMPMLDIRLPTVQPSRRGARCVDCGDPATRGTRCTECWTEIQDSDAA